jgi:hypothetical protein
METDTVQTSAETELFWDAVPHAGGCPAEPLIWELIPNPIEASRRAPAGPRLNLVIPWMSSKRLTGGGPATAVRLFQRLADEFPHSRIVVTHEVESDFDFAGWPGLVRDQGNAASRSITFLGDRSTPLRVGPEDYFIATFWSTAIFAKSIASRQSGFFGMPLRRFLYLLQDYEPGFYPWSARHAGAASTYEDLDGVIGVFNTSLLAEYFERQGLRYKERYVFEPILNPELLRRRSNPHPPGKERLILVYGRPSVPRNDFDFVVDALRIWAREFAGAPNWSVVSAGEPHADIPLGNNVVLRSAGQMTLEQYADHLSRCWAGFSFMFSAHPSYPPLEMAEFGAWVVTNRFANKNPALLSPNIIAVGDIWPTEAAKKLGWCCEQYRPNQTSVMPNLAPLFTSGEQEFPFAAALAASWLQRAKVNAS